MADKTTLARPYAGAVFKQALTEDKLDSWAEMLDFLAAAAADPAMRGVLSDPRIGTVRKADIMLDVATGRLSATGENLVRVLAENGRLGLLPEIAELYGERMAAHVGRSRVEVVSAYEVNPKFRQVITGAMAKRLGREVELSVTLDESLIGGVVVRAGDLVIDASLRGRLKQLEAKLK